MPAASRIVISYPADVSDWGRDQLATPWFEGYLRKTLGTVEVGTEWEEFVDIGCCGNSLDIPLRIEAIEGGDTVANDTEIDWTTREACGIEGGWRVQSAAGPTS